MGVMTTEWTGVDMASSGKDVTVFVGGEIVGTFTTNTISDAKTTLEENEVKPLNFIVYTFFVSIPGYKWVTMGGGLLAFIHQGSHPNSRTKRKAQLRRKNNGHK